MRCLFLTANSSWAEPFIAALVAEGYEVDVRLVAPGGTVRLDGVDYPIVFLHIALGLETVRTVASARPSSSSAVAPLIALVGELSTDNDVDALIHAGASIYVDADPNVFKRRIRFLRGALRGRSRIEQLMTDLRDGEAKYRAVVAALDEGLIVQGHDEKVTALNPAAGRTLGLSDDDVVNRRWRAADWNIVGLDGNPVPLDDLPSLRALRTGVPVRGCVLGMGRPDRDRVWISINSQPVHDSKATTVAVVTTFSDITARRRTEEDFLELLERAPDAVLLHKDGRTLWANSKWADLLGYDDPRSLVGRPILEFVSPRFRGVVAERVRLRAQGQTTIEPAGLEQALLHRDGRDIDVAVFGVPTVYAGEPVLAAFARDLTEQRRLEMELVAAERLAALGRLAAGVGHEINNPLSYVMGNVQMVSEVLQGRGADDLVEALAEALQGAERIRLIVRDLKVLGTSKGDDVSPVDLHQIVDSCARIAESEIRLRARLVRDFGEVPQVLANEPRLAQIVLNLLVNAAQAIPEGQGSSHTITVSSRVEPDGRVALRIADTGTGIAPEHLPHVFEPFFTTKAERGGSGLGLSICRMLVASQGGEIAIDSFVGRGTVVTVRLRPAAAPGRSLR
jgi:PAS domain S-box-containing protein